jgi:hypothetical protein
MGRTHAARGWVAGGTYGEADAADALRPVRDRHEGAGGRHALAERGEARVHVFDERSLHVGRLGMAEGARRDARRERVAHGSGEECVRHTMKWKGNLGSRR